MSATGAPTDTGSDPKDVSRRLLWLLPAGFVVYAVLLGVGDIGEALEVLGAIDLGVVALAAALEVLTVVSLAQVYRSSLVAVGGGVGYRQGLEVSMSAFTVTQALPGGGAFGVVVATRRLIHFGASNAAAAATAALTGILAMLTLGLLVAAGVAFAVPGSDLPGAVLVVVVLVVLVLAVVTIVLLGALRSVAFGQRLLDRVERLLSRLDPVLARFGLDLDLDAWREPLVEVAANAPTLPQLVRVVGWSAVNWTTDMAALWFVLAGLGEPVTLGVLLLAFGVENLAVMIPISPGGVGLVEAGMAGVLLAVGVPSGAAVAGVLGYRVLSYWLPMLAGVPQYLRGPQPGAERG